MDIPPESILPEQIQAVRRGDRRVLARALTEVENDTPPGRLILDRLFPYTGNAHWVGVTGSPGVGKSSLVNQLVRQLRMTRPEERIAILAVDPTSPFTGGAVLGDRVRMRDLATDPGVFIRSMASRGALGGLAAATSALAQVFDAAGFAFIFIETVGAGQSEVEIASLAHTTLVVEAPGLGDDVQAIKAGILEIADILVVNKADQPGAEAAIHSLKGMVELGFPQGGHHPADLSARLADAVGEGDSQALSWVPPVLPAVSIRPEGIPAIIEAILSHRAYLIRSGEWEKKDTERLKAVLVQELQASLLAQWEAHHMPGLVDAGVEELRQRRATPQEILQKWISS